MIITTKQLKEFVRLTKAACYNYDEKCRYQRLGKKILKALAAELKLPDGSYDIRWNPGGDACSGDHTLHHENFYVALHDNIGFGWFYYRTCKGRKDYSGGTNRIVYWYNLTNFGIEWLAKEIQRDCPMPAIAKAHPLSLVSTVNP